VVVVIVAYGVAVSDPIMLLWAIPAAGVGWWFSERAGRPLPKLIVHILTACAVLYAALSWFSLGAGGGTGGAAIGAIWAVYLQVIKLADRKTTRDEAQFLTLSFLLIIGTMLTSNTLLLIPFLLALIRCSSRPSCSTRSARTGPGGPRTRRGPGRFAAASPHAGRGPDSLAPAGRAPATTSA